MADGLLRLKHAAGPLGTIVTCVLVVWGLGADLSVPAYMWDRPRWLHKICSHYSSCRLSQVESALISCNASLTQRAKQHFYCIPCLTATGLQAKLLSEEAINLSTPWKKITQNVSGNSFYRCDMFAFFQYYADGLHVNFSVSLVVSV